MTLQYLLPLLALLIVVAVLMLDQRQRRREARRRGDMVFMARALEVAQRNGRRRPKVDRRIQRRRYGSG
jgi:hypothetical protein